MRHTFLRLNDDRANEESAEIAISNTRLFRISLALLTFSLGSFAVFLLNWGMEPPLPSATTDVPVVDGGFAERAEDPTPRLSFSRSGGIACGQDSLGNRFSWTSYMASDGEIVGSEFVGVESLRLGDKRFEKELRSAVKVIEQEPLLDNDGKHVGRTALIETKGVFVLLEYKRIGSNPAIRVSTARDPKYLKAFALN